MNVFLKLFSRRYWWATLLVVAGAILFVRLGIWQLDRLDQKRAFNARVAERWKMEPYDLTANDLPADLSELEYRRIQATGDFDYANQIVLKEQVVGGASGVYLVTPLRLDDGRAVLVARGWVPYGQDTPEHWPQFEEPPGAPVIGLIQKSHLLPNGEAPSVPAEPQTEWFYLNIDAIQPQMPYDLLPVFIYMLPEAGRAYDQLPIRYEPLTLSEGNHLSYAVQWFSFAVILGVGYIFLVRFQEIRRARLAREAEQTGTVLETGAPLPPHAGHAG